MDINTLVHSKLCRRSSLSLTKGMGDCIACDTLKSLKIKNSHNVRMEETKVDMDGDRLERVYCKIAKTKYPRCTKKTYPKCACGKLVYFRDMAKDSRFDD